MGSPEAVRRSRAPTRTAKNAMRSFSSANPPLPDERRWLHGGRDAVPLLQMKPHSALGGQGTVRHTCRPPAQPIVARTLPPPSLLLSALSPFCSPLPVPLAGPQPLLCAPLWAVAPPRTRAIQKKKKKTRHRARQRPGREAGWVPSALPPAPSSALVCARCAVSMCPHCTRPRLSGQIPILNTGKENQRAAATRSRDWLRMAPIATWLCRLRPFLPLHQAALGWVRHRLQSERIRQIHGCHRAGRGTQWSLMMKRLRVGQRQILQSSDLQLAVRTVA
jgi:hypothetical protein